MKNFKIKTKNLIALGLMTVLAFTGAFAYQTQAAGEVDTTATVTITANVNSGDNSVFAANFGKGDGYISQVDVDLYKIADADRGGNLINPEGVSADALNTLKGNNVSVQDIETNIVEPAYEYFVDGNKESDAKITVAGAGKTGSATISGGAGLYLYVPKAAQDDYYDYTFTHYVIMVPGSEYIANGQGSDEWNYTATFNLKSEAEHRLGSLQINKSLKTYNQSLGEGSFVYNVEAKFGEDTVYSNVVSITADDAGVFSSEVIKGIPAGSVVTITEVYTGASYSAEATTVSPVTIVADELVSATFTNDYNDKLIVGSTALENHFVKTEDGTYEWVDAVPLEQ